MTHSGKPAVTHSGKPGATRRRWHRVAIPFTLLTILFLVSGVAHARQEPNLADPGTLSPTGTGPDGSSRLAGLLEAEGVTIHRVGRSADALDALRDATGTAPATILVPAPELVDPRFFDLARARPGAHRLVLIRPGTRVSAELGLASSLPRWAARTVAPDCRTPFAAAAGAASVLRTRYAAARENASIDCYRGALVGIEIENQELIVVGASEPFRNRRIAEAGNAALATGLLNRHRQLIWIDLHQAEPRPSVQPSLAMPEYRQPGRGSGGTSPIWGAFPPVLWASLVLLAALAVLMALVRARRLGPPVAEPLPVVVPATETVTGRGRLYQRIRARPATFESLRAAALRRLARATATVGDPGRPGDGGTHPDLATLTQRIVAPTGLRPEEVAGILDPPPPETDEALVEAVARLDALLAAVDRGTRPAGPAPPALSQGPSGQAGPGQHHSGPTGPGQHHSGPTGPGQHHGGEA